MCDIADQYSVFHERGSIMDLLAEYILSVVCTAVLCGIIMLLFDKNTAVTGVLKLVLGIVMTVTILTPVLKEDIFSYDLYFNTLGEDSAEAALEGSRIANTMREELIIGEIQEYILNKAETLGAQLAVKVSLQEDNFPESICMSGSVSPYAKKQLEHFICTQLGIRKECLSWE